MIKGTEKAPAIRFRGFTDDWEQRKLGEITKANSFKQYIAEGTLDGTYEVIQQGDTPVVGYADGKPFEDYEDVSLFGDHTLSLYKPKSPFFVASDGIKILSPSISINGLFYYYLLMRYKPHSEGYKRHYTILKSCEALYPTESEEQKKIGEYFANLDNLITLHQHKLEQQKKLKAFFLKNMFPEEGETVPRIRFKEFTGDWEQRKIADVAEIITGGTPSTRIVEYWNPPEVPWLSSGEVHKKYITSTYTMISRKGYENSSATMVRENSVLIALAGQGKTRGTVAINRIPLATNQSIAAMTFSDDIDPDYVFSNLENRYEELRRISSGDGSRGGLNKKLVGDVTIPCPTLLEQNAIGTLFRVLNELITLHQRKIDQLQAMKKFMLQNLFV